MVILRYLEKEFETQKTTGLSNTDRTDDRVAIRGGNVGLGLLSGLVRRYRHYWQCRHADRSAGSGQIDHLLDGGDINISPKFCWWIDLFKPRLCP